MRGPVDALVTWEGDWLLAYPAYDPVLAADPRAMSAWTPWAALPTEKQLEVAMLVSSDPGAEYQTPLPDTTATNAFFAPRDPSGDLRRRLEATGALADHSITLAEEQQLLYSVLRDQSNPVTLDLMPDSTHDSLGDAGWAVFLDAFRKAVTRP